MQRFKAVLFSLAVAAVPATAAESQDSFDSVLRPFLSHYCVGCHGPEKQKAEINFSSYGGNTRLVEDRKRWETVHEMLSKREMPPKKEPQPSEQEREAILHFIDAELAKFDCAKGPIYPGRVTLRRLNRAEYNNTIRDLTGLDLKPAAQFPNDSAGYGFNNIGDVLSLPPMLMEKYLAAAELVATNAVLSQYPPPRPVESISGNRFQAVPGSDRTAIRSLGKTLGLYREGTATAEFTFPVDGDYRLRVRAYGELAGPEPPRLAVLMQGKTLKEFDVPVEANKARVYELNCRVEAGRRVLGLAFLNNYVVSDHPDPKFRGDRNLFVSWLEIEGPLDAPVPPPPASHHAIISCDPLHKHTRDCARQALGQFAEKAYRRSVSSNEVERLLKFTEIAKAEGGNFFEGIQVGVQAILTSPQFLFRWELDPESDQPSGVRALTDWELASRLSYFLWSSMPDDELLALAREGRLSQPQVLSSQVRRMLQDPKAHAITQNFAGQWLTLHNLDLASPDPELYPEFDDALRAAMKRESELFFAAIVREDRSILDLVDADFTYLNERLARHYGVPGVKGEEFQRVSLTKESGRGGILTQGSILTLTSTPTRTSPVVRGKFVMEQILGTPPPPPPPDVPQLVENKEALEAASLRERLELHRAKPECATCHSKMDPIGFAFENFNAIGAWRDRDGKFPIDTSGTLPDGHTIGGPQDLKTFLKTQNAFARTLAEKMLTYALGRGLEYYDKCAVDDIYAALAHENYRFSVLVNSIVQSEPFRKKAIGEQP